MINQRRRDDQTTAVTFTLEDPRLVSVVGDFNDWDPFVNPLIPRPNGMQSAIVQVPTGTELHFRYLADGGEFFDDLDADELEPNGFGETHSVLRTGS